MSDTLETESIKRFCRKCKGHNLKVAAHSACPFKCCHCTKCEKINSTNEIARERARKRRADGASAVPVPSSSSNVTVEQILAVANKNSSEEQRRKQLSPAAFQAERLKDKRRELSEYDKFVNSYMASLTDQEKLRSPLSNMALATQAWRQKQQKPISARVEKKQKKQEDELTSLGFNADFTTVDHIDFGLASPLESMFPQLPTCHLEKHLTDANGKLDEATDSLLLETQTQDIVNPCNQVLVYNKTQNNDDMLIQMFPQYSREGIQCAFQSCNYNMYDTVDLLLKLLPEQSRRQQDPPKVISFSQSASGAVDNVPNSQLNPFAKALASTSGNVGSRRKNHFCKKCGHLVPPTDALGPICPNPSCGYPLPQNLRM